MNVTMLAVFLGLFAFSGTGYGSTDEVGKIVVNLTGFRNNHGKAMVVLYNSEDGYPGSYEKAFSLGTSVITQEEAEVVFSNIPYGGYALEVLHDENANGQMDTNWLKMPKEGYAFSNNAKGLIGPPSFEKAKFVVDSTELMQTLEMNYL